MADLSALRAAVDVASNAFDAACRPHFANRWAYYHAVECGRPVPRSVHDACDAYLAATHAYYRARDGERGFLGGRGL